MPPMQVHVNKRATMGKPKRGALPVGSELRTVNLELVVRHYSKKAKPPYCILVISDTPDLVLADICKRLQNLESRTVLTKTLASNPSALSLIDIQADCIFLDQAIGAVKPEYKQRVYNAVFRHLRYRGLMVTTQRECFKENNTGFVPVFMQDASSPFPNTPYPSNPTSMRNMLYNAGFDPIYETARWLQFSAYACIKGSSKGVSHAR